MTYKNKKTVKLYHRLYSALGNGAEITIDWLTGAVRLAKKSWNVSYPDFEKGMYRLLIELKLSVDNYQNILQSAWNTIP